jgi:AbrB family looped-hinge helix DNA binding protein
MPTTVTLSSKNQIVVPKEAREKLRIGPGDKLLVLTKDDRVVLIPRSKNFVSRMKGLHKDIWGDLDTDAYIDQERESWKG